MVDVNLTISIITLNVNEPEVVRMDKKRKFQLVCMRNAF